jgi:hypothetical protein
VDFGYYDEPASLGNWVWNDVNQDGVQDTGELGIAGVDVFLTISYPNGDTVTLQTTTDSSGYYSFDNLLLDENFDGAGGGEPTYVLSVDQSTVPTGFVASPQNQTTEDLDSDNPVAQPATVVQGQLNDTYDFGFYGKPTNVDLISFTAEGAKKTIIIRWETATERKNLGFNLYRAESEDGERLKLNEDLIPTLVPPGSPFGAQYEFVDDDKKLKNKVVYYYWLETVDTQGETEQYGPVTAQIGKQEMQVSLTATGAAESITVNWETTNELDIEGFNLYRAERRDGERTQLNAELIPSLVPPGSSGGAQYEYVDDDEALNAQETYYYWLEAVDSTGATELYGPVSAELVVPVVDLISFTATGAAKSITLDWETASEIDNMGFNLYRATAEDGERTKLNAELLPPGSPDGAQYEFVDDDKKLRNNATYYYWLEAVDAQGRTQLHGPVWAELVRD